MTIRHEEQLKSLTNWFAKRERVAVACSGGADSTLLLALAHNALGTNAVAFTASIASQPKEDQTFIESFCAQHGIKHNTFDLDELSIPGFKNNPPERCYLCKKHLYKQLKTLASEQDISCIVDGTNLDDLQADRPGRKALEEEGVNTPFVDCGLTKADVRALSRILELPTSQKPSNSCLYTRLAFNQEITSDKLALIARAEQALEPLGLKRVRARLSQDGLKLELVI